MACFIVLYFLVSCLPSYGSDNSKVTLEFQDGKTQAYPLTIVQLFPVLQQITGELGNKITIPIEVHSAENFTLLYNLRKFLLEKETKEAANKTPLSTQQKQAYENLSQVTTATQRMAEHAQQYNPSVKVNTTFTRYDTGKQVPFETGPKSDFDIQIAIKKIIGQIKTPDLLQQLIIDADYMLSEPRFRDILVETWSSYFTNMQLPDAVTMPFTIQADISKRLITRLLQDNKHQGPRVTKTIPSLYELGKYSSENGIVCLERLADNKQANIKHYIFENNSLKENYSALISDEKPLWCISCGSLPNLENFIYCILWSEGIKTPQSPKRLSLLLFDITNTKKYTAEIMDITSADDDYPRIGDIIYDQTSKQILIARANATREFSYSILLAKFDPEKPTPIGFIEAKYNIIDRSGSAVIDYEKLDAIRWKIIDTNIIGCGNTRSTIDLVFIRDTNELLNLLPDEQKKVWFYEKKNSKKEINFIVLEAQDKHLSDSTERAAYPVNFVENYAELLNRKIAHYVQIQDNRRNLSRSFDFTHLRYLETYKTAEGNGAPWTDTISIVDILQPSAKRGLDFVNKTYFDKKEDYTNLLFDVWTIYHGEMQTRNFQDTNLKNASPLIQELYKPIQAKIKEKQEKVAAKAALDKRDTPIGFAKPWKLELFKSMRHDLGSWWADQKTGLNRLWWRNVGAVITFGGLIALTAGLKIRNGGTYQFPFQRR